jgi:hypothetical protein
MNHLEFMHHLRKQEALNPAHAPTARTYPNNAGVDALIHLPESMWDYVDWLEARGDIDFSAWVIHCEKTPCEGYTLSHLLMYWLWLDECRRHRAGLPTPNAILPAGYEAYGEAANDW